MNGVVMHSADAPRLADFLWRHIALKPPDLLWVEWVVRQAKPIPAAAAAVGAGVHQGAGAAAGAAAGTAEEAAEDMAAAAPPTSMSQRVLPEQLRRPYIVYRHNLLRHLGALSSFAVRPDRPDWPGCFAPMTK